MGITLGLLAASSILELFVMRAFRAVIYVVETFLQRSFWPVERLLFAILVCLIATGFLKWLASEISEQEIDGLTNEDKLMTETGIG
jgi:hypothetical protein